jgi:rhamnopyranosyl-N-acetylglucosaminyl-diphospho-decaprenol beta-1,3/1,4-galactofuranosyltransferase
MNNKKKCAIVVTFNRKQDLIVCITRLLEQTVMLDEILIIDNASTDGTYDFLIKNQILDSKVKCINGQTAKKHNGTNVLYFQESTNTGGAGGFSKGQQLAIQRENYYIWLMDDDGVAESDTFELLLNSISSASVDIVNPMVIDINNKEKLSFGLSPSIINVEDAERMKNDDGMIYDLCNPFNGTLMTSDIINKIGFIKSQMFIWGDELEYIERAVSNGYKLGTNVNAKFYHPTSKTIYESFFFNKFKMVTKPARLQMNFYRNQAYLCSKYSSGFGKFNPFIKYLLYFLLKGNPVTFINYIRYFFDGYFDRYKLPPIVN